jgi:hypothetical protein
MHYENGDFEMKFDCMKFVLFLSAQIFVLGLAHAAEVKLSTDNQNPQVGDKITISVDLAGFPDTHGGGLNLTYNRNVLRATSVQVNPTWGFVNKNGTINNATGSINNILFSDFAGKSGDVPVAVIEMEVISAGDANISATESAQSGFAGSDFGRMSVTINNSQASLSVQGSDISETGEEADEIAPEPREDASQIVQEDVSTAGRPGFAMTGDPESAETAVANNVTVSDSPVYTGDKSRRTRPGESRAPVPVSAFATSSDKIVQSRNTDRVASGTETEAVMSGSVTTGNGSASSTPTGVAHIATDNAGTPVSSPQPNNASSMIIYMMIGLSLAGVFGIIAFRRTTA